MPEHSRALPHRTQQLLPIERVAESDGAYLESLDSAELPDGVTAIVRWLIVEGRRDSGDKRLAVRTQRRLAKVLGIGASTVCDSLRRLRDSGLVTKVDGEYRLRLALLVEIGEIAETRRQQATQEVDPAAALDALTAPPARARSACSGALGGDVRSVEENNTPPVSVPESVSVPGGSGGLRTAAERGERDDCLREHSAWRQLQTHHFRQANRPAIAVAALQPCFYAAVEADLLDNEPEHKIRFLAVAYDLAAAVPRWDAAKRKEVGVRSPAVCLRVRTEREALFRASPEGHAWAKKIVFGGGPNREENSEEREVFGGCR